VKKIKKFKKLLQYGKKDDIISKNSYLCMTSAGKAFAAQEVKLSGFRFCG